MKRATDNPTLGISLMLVFCIMAPFADAVAKTLSPHLPILQLVVLRFAVQFLLLLPFVIGSQRGLGLSRRTAGFAVLRALLQIAGIATFFLALRHLPLAEAVAIAFVSPFLLLLAGWLFLGEEVGPRRLAACTLGFAGTLLVVQPTFAAVGWYALLPLGAALAFSAFMILTRHVAQDIDAVALQFVTAGVALVVVLPALAFGAVSGLPELAPRPLPPGIWGLVLLLGAAGTTAHLVMTWSLRYAPAATLAPIQYLEIPGATFVGWLFFGHLPNGLALAGIMLTITAGLAIVALEHRARLRQRAAAS